LAVFDMPSQAVDCALDLCADLGLQICAGLHAGEIEVHDDEDISGLAVNLAARVEQHAADGEVWVSSTIRDMMLGSSTSFVDKGEHKLKGIEDAWHLYSTSRQP
jgi:class 3 adenylate cyclase